METERDYCLFIDCRKYNRNSYCRKHDNAYGVFGGGHAKDRLDADRRFYNAMKGEGDPVALPCFVACRAFGWFFFNYRSGKPWKGQLIKRLFRRYRPA